jgi:hypothetical protein
MTWQGRQGDGVEGHSRAVDARTLQ